MFVHGNWVHHDHDVENCISAHLNHMPSVLHKRKWWATIGHIRSSNLFLAFSASSWTWQFLGMTRYDALTVDACLVGFRRRTLGFESIATGSNYPVIHASRAAVRTAAKTMSTWAAWWKSRTVKANFFNQLLIWFGILQVLELHFKLNKKCVCVYVFPFQTP